MYEDNIKLLKSFKFDNCFTEECYTETVRIIEKFVLGTIYKTELIDLVSHEDDPYFVGGEEFSVCLMLMLYENKDRTEIAEALTQIMIDNYYKYIQ